MTDIDTTEAARTVRIARGTQALSSDEAFDMCLMREGKVEITDECALAIASWWQGGRGHALTLTELTSHADVPLEALRQAIYEAYTQATNRLDRLALDMLATWALNGPGEWGK